MVIKTKILLETSLPKPTFLLEVFVAISLPVVSLKYLCYEYLWPVYDPSEHGFINRKFMRMYTEIVSVLLNTRRLS